MKQRKSYLYKLWVKAGLLFVIIVAPAAVFAVDESVDSVESSGASASQSNDSQLIWSASVGVGYDSNIYRTPSDPYTDYAPPTSILINPKVQSGAFVPLRYRVKHESGLNGNNVFVARYRFSGDFYTDSKFSNAKETAHTINIGNEHILARKKWRKDIVYAGLIYSDKREQYTDRDSGLDKTLTAGDNISDRYSYTAAGFEARYENRTSVTQYGFEFKAIDRNYDDVPVVAQYDYKFMLIGGDVKFRLSKLSKLKLTYKHYQYDYDERRPRNIDGRLRPVGSNSTLEYIYDKFQVSYILRFNKKLKTYLTYGYTVRSDEFVGYNDYDRNKFTLKTKYDYSKKLEMEIVVTYWERDYDNAFAFDRFVQNVNEEGKNYDQTKVQFEIDYFIDRHQIFWVDFEWRDENSTDLRYAYDRSKIMTGIKWDY